MGLYQSARIPTAVRRPTPTPKKPTDPPTSRVEIDPPEPLHIGTEPLDPNPTKKDPVTNLLSLRALAQPTSTPGTKPTSNPELDADITKGNFIPGAANLSIPDEFADKGQPTSEEIRDAAEQDAKHPDTIQAGERFKNDAQFLKSLKDGGGSLVKRRTQQYLDNDYDPATKTHGTLTLEEARKKALTDVGQAITLGYASPVSETSTEIGSALGKQKYLVGSMPLGGTTVPVYRVESNAAYAADTLQLPEHLAVATGIPQKASDALFGRGKDIDGQKYKDVSALDAIASRRNISDVLGESAQQNPITRLNMATEGKDPDTAPYDPHVKIATAIAGGAADVLFPDLLTITTMGGSRLLKAGTALLGADGRIFLGIAEKADAEAHLAKLAAAEKEASNVTHEALDAESAASRVEAYGASVKEGEKEAEKFGKPFVKELNRRTMAAVSGEIGKESTEVQYAFEAVVLDQGRHTKDVPSLLENLGSYATPHGEPEMTHAVLAAVGRARIRAIQSMTEDLAKVPVEVSKTPVGSLSLVKGTGVATRDVLTGASHSQSALSKLGEVLGFSTTGSIKEIEKGVRSGAVKLTEEEYTALRTSVAKQIGMTEQQLPPGIVPMPGVSVTPAHLAKIDQVIADGRKAIRTAPDTSTILMDSIRPKLEVVNLLPTHIRESPMGVSAGHIRDWVAQKMKIGLGYGNMLVHGGDETKPFTDKGLSKAVRETVVRCQRGVDQVVADAGKLRNEKDAAAYLSSEPTRGSNKALLIMGGKDHYELFAAAYHIHLVGSSGISHVAESFIPTEMLDGLVGSAHLETLENHVLSWFEGDFAHKLDLMGSLREETKLVLGVVDPEGWRRFVVGVASQGQQLTHAEELLGMGIVLSDADRLAMIDTLSATAYLPDDDSRSFRNADIQGLRFAEIEQERLQVICNKAIGSGDILEFFDVAKALDENFEMRTQSAKDIADLEENSKRRLTTLEAAQRSTTISPTMKPQTPLVPYGKVVDLSRKRVFVLPTEAQVAQGVGVRLLAVDKIFSKETRDVLDRIKTITTSKHYVPQFVKEQLAESLSKAMQRSNPAAVPFLNMYKQGMTRGIWFVNPHYNVSQVIGDFEQTLFAHGALEASESLVRSLLQQATGTPIVGQALSFVGQGENARELASTVGDIFVGGKVLDVLSTLKKGGNLTTVMHNVTRLSEVNRILDGDASIFRLGDRMFSGKALREEAVRAGVFDSFPSEQIAGEVELTTEQIAKKWKPHQWSIELGQAVRGSVQDVVQGIGERQRVGLFATLLRHGATPEEAGTGVVRALYDFKYSMADADRNTVVKFAFPFWAWQKNAFRQMTETLMSPWGAYKIKALMVGEEEGTDWFNHYNEQKDVDPFGLRVGSMNDTGVQLARLRVIASLVKSGYKPSEFRDILVKGDESHVYPTEELQTDYRTIAPYIVGEMKDTDVSHMYEDRAIIKFRPKIQSDAQIRDLLYNPASKNTPADWIGVVLPASMSDYFNYIGCYADAAQAAVLGGGKSPMTILQDNIDPGNIPFVGVFLKNWAGKPNTVYVPEIAGAALHAMGVVDLVPDNRNNDETWKNLGSTGVQVKKDAGHPVRYALANDTLNLAWNSIAVAGKSAFVQSEMIKQTWESPGLISGAMLASGMPTSKISPSNSLKNQAHQAEDSLKQMRGADHPFHGALDANPVVVPPVSPIDQ